MSPARQARKIIPKMLIPRQKEDPARGARSGRAGLTLSAAGRRCIWLGPTAPAPQPPTRWAAHPAALPGHARRAGCSLITAPPPLRFVLSRTDRTSSTLGKPFTLLLAPGAQNHVSLRVPPLLSGAWRAKPAATAPPAALTPLPGVPPATACQRAEPLSTGLHPSLHPRAAYIGTARQRTMMLLSSSATGRQVAPAYHASRAAGTARAPARLERQLQAQARCSTAVGSKQWLAGGSRLQAAVQRTRAPISRQHQARCGCGGSCMFSLPMPSGPGCGRAATLGRLARLPAGCKRTQPLPRPASAPGRRPAR